LLFRVIADSYESKSLILTTNSEFSKWGSVFTDEQMAAARMMSHPVPEVAMLFSKLTYYGHPLRSYP